MGHRKTQNSGKNLNPREISIMDLKREIMLINQKTIFFACRIEQVSVIFEMT